jgi:hypothetical protein
MLVGTCVGAGDSPAQSYLSAKHPAHNAMHFANAL